MMSLNRFTKALFHSWAVVFRNVIFTSNVETLTKGQKGIISWMQFAHFLYCFLQQLIGKHTRKTLPYSEPMRRSVSLYTCQCRNQTGLYTKRTQKPTQLSCTEGKFYWARSNGLMTQKRFTFKILHIPFLSFPFPKHIASNWKLVFMHGKNLKILSTLCISWNLNPQCWNA